MVWNILRELEVYLLMMKLPKQLKNEKWYHGTTLSGWHSLCQKKIDVQHNKKHELDFGYGFYLTHNQQQAETYIKNTIEYNKRELSSIVSDVGFGLSDDSLIPVVIEFDFSPLPLFQSGEYEYQILNRYDDDFAEFVFHNRVYNVDGLAHHSYDLIYGVMSDSLPMILIPEYRRKEKSKEQVIEALKKATRDTQLSIHSQEICDKMKVNRVYLVETNKELKRDDYNN